MLGFRLVDKALGREFANTLANSTEAESQKKASKKQHTGEFFRATITITSKSKWRSDALNRPD